MTESEKDAFIVQLTGKVTMYRDGMCLKYRATIGRIASEKEEMFNVLYSVYSYINSVKCASELLEKHKKVLAGNSKAMFAEAVNLDKELKKYGSEED